METFKDFLKHLLQSKLLKIKSLDSTVLTVTVITLNYV